MWSSGLHRQLTASTPKCSVASARAVPPSTRTLHSALWYRQVSSRARGSNAADAPAADGAAASSPRGTAHGASRGRPRGSRQAKSPLMQRVSSMPGVGPKYESLLAAHNIRTVSDLMRMHVEVHAGQMDATQRFLKDEVGINNSGCLRSMTAYMAQKRQELEDDIALTSSDTAGGHNPVPSWLQPKVTLSVEGNISAGKSTFLRILEGSGLLSTKLQVVQEPVQKWQNVGVGKENVNLLMEFYKAPERFAYTFQNYVFLTRMMQERESYTTAAMCRLLERSVFSDKMVFVRSVHAARFMSDTELAIYNSWFDPVLSTLPTLVPNGFIYLKAQPTTCFQRLHKRARSEETTVKLDYLQDLHSKHEDWLVQGGTALTDRDSRYLWVEPTKQVLTRTTSAPPQSAAGGSLYPGLRFDVRAHAPSPSEAHVSAVRLPPVPRELNHDIRFLDTTRGEHMHPLLHTIPALVLDCDADVDVERDEAYQAHVAAKVSKYCDYVRQCMIARGDAVVDQEHRAARALAYSGHPLPASSSHGGLTSAAARRGNDGVWFPPSGQYTGYSMDVRGTTLYLDPKAPLVAYASRETRDLAAGRVLTDDAAQAPQPSQPSAGEVDAPPPGASGVLGEHTRSLLRDTAAQGSSHGHGGASRHDYAAGRGRSVLHSTPN